MYAQERQQAIASLISQRGRISVADLAENFAVTTETVRRDLAVLDRIGLVKRVHGGAVPASTLTSIEPGVTERETTRADQKDRIAAKALAYLPAAGGSALLDAGTTTGRLAALLPVDRDMDIVTNSVPIGARLAGMPAIRLHLLGGRVRGLTRAAVGEDALRVLDRTRVDVAFMGTNALSHGHGLSTPDPDEAAVKRAMVAAADHVVVLADSAKVGREFMVSFATVEQIHVVITDDGIADADVTELREHGIEVVVA